MRLLQGRVQTRGHRAVARRRLEHATAAATLILVLLSVSSAGAQSLSTGDGASMDSAAASNLPDNAQPDSGKAANLQDVSRMSLREFNLSLVILVFGALVLLAEVMLLRRMQCSAEEVLRVFGITLIVMGTLLVVPAGFSAQSIAPAMGLLGTVAGYLLSQRSEKRAKPPQSNEADGQ